MVTNFDNEILLKKITINGFQSTNRILDVHLSDNKVSIIYGGNGTGKTTFLKLLNAILNQDNITLYDENVYAVEIYFTENNGSEIFNRKVVIEQRLELSSSEEQAGIEYDWTQFNDSFLSETKSLSLGIERGVTQAKTKLAASDIYNYITNSSYKKYFQHMNRNMFAEDLSDFVERRESKRRVMRTRKKSSLSLDNNHSFLENIKMENIEEVLLNQYRQARNVATEQIQIALFDTLSFIFDSTKVNDILSVEKFELDDDFINSLYSSKNRLIEALDDGYDDNHFRIQMIDLLTRINSKNDIRYLVNTKLLYNLIDNMIEELELEKLLLNSINTFVEQFNKFLDDSKKLVITYDEIFVLIDDDKYSIDVLSSGERHIFTFLSLIIIDGRHRNFIFIDEPEISLNMKWQRILMRLLSELAPRTQIIVASHSPMISKNMNDSLVALNVEQI